MKHAVRWESWIQIGGNPVRHAPVYSLGAAFALDPAWDVTFAYSFQSAPMVSGNLLGLGTRCHFNVPAPGAEVYMVGALASIRGFDRRPMSTQQ